MTFQSMATGVFGRAGHRVQARAVSGHVTEDVRVLTRHHRIKVHHVLGTEHRRIPVLTEHAQVYKY